MIQNYVSLFKQNVFFFSKKIIIVVKLDKIEMFYKFKTLLHESHNKDFDII